MSNVTTGITEYQVGSQLITKNPKKIGNITIICEEEPILHYRMFTVISDYGNIIEGVSEHTLETCFEEPWNSGLSVKELLTHRLYLLKQALSIIEEDSSDD